MNKVQANAIVNAYLINQVVGTSQADKLHKRLVVQTVESRNELLDALDLLNIDYMMTPAKVRDKSFQKPGEENYKTVWVVVLIDKSKIEEQHTL